MLYASLAFGGVSVLAYSIWAYKLIAGTGPMYVGIAAIYVGVSGLALSRLVRGPESWKRFPLRFALAFTVYALCWCAFWFGLKGKHHADLWGAAAGLAGMTWILRAGFAQRPACLPLFGVLFLFHTLGYTLGDVLYALVRGTNGRLLWGAAHGLGFGAGLGYVLHRCQREA